MFFWKFFISYILSNLGHKIFSILDFFFENFLIFKFLYSFLILRIINILILIRLNDIRPVSKSQ